MQFFLPVAVSNLLAEIVQKHALAAASHLARGVELGQPEISGVSVIIMCMISSLFLSEHHAFRRHAPR